jgi:hypothetical protein
MQGLALDLRDFNVAALTLVSAAVCFRESCAQAPAKVTRTSEAKKIFMVASVRMDECRRQPCLAGTLPALFPFLSPQREEKSLFRGSQ